MTAASAARERELEHGVAPHDVSDPFVTWLVSTIGLDKATPFDGGVIVFRGIPSRDVAMSFVRDFWRSEIVLLEHHDCIVEMDGQRVAFIPFALADEPDRACGMVAPEMRCRTCRRTI